MAPQEKNRLQETDEISTRTIIDIMGTKGNANGEVAGIRWPWSTSFIHLIDKTLRLQNNCVEEEPSRRLLVGMWGGRSEELGLSGASSHQKKTHN